MPQIPDASDLGARRIPRAARGIVEDRSGEILAQSTQRFAQSIAGLADDIHVQSVNMARSKASNALLDNQLAVKKIHTSIANKVETGELNYQEAPEAYKKAVGELAMPEIKYLDPEAGLHLRSGIERAKKEGELGIGALVNKARHADYQDQFTQGLDKLGKLAGYPGAKIETLNGNADALAAQAKNAGIPAPIVDKTVQSFKDQNWYNQASERIMLARQDKGELIKLGDELTKGQYLGKLDTDKRNVLLNQVESHRIQLENSEKVDANRREAKAERAINEIDRQISSGVPATPTMWSTWKGTISGTTLEPELKDRIDDEMEVQKVLRAPIQQQVKYVQDKESALKSDGGTTRALANYNRLHTAVTQNVKLLNEAPLQFNATRTGGEVQPLDIEGLANGDDTAAAQVKDRTDTLKAMRNQYGNVPLKVLLPQEAAQLSNSLAKATPKQQSEMFGSLYKSMDDQTYKAAMQQIAPDSPVRALAGMLSGKQAQMTTKTHWFKPDEIAHSGDVSATILQGEDMLNESKVDKKTDGKPKLSLYLPETNTLQLDFQDQVGDAFAGRPAAADVAFQAVKAYYVGRAAQTGRIASNNKDIDAGLVKEAITASLGAAIDYNGSTVFAPWGMDRAAFVDRAHLSLAAEAKRVGMNADAAKALTRASLKNAGDGTYYVTQGHNFVTDTNGKPLVVTIQ